MTHEPERGGEAAGGAGQAGEPHPRVRYFQEIAARAGLPVRVSGARYSRSAFAGTEVFDVTVEFAGERLYASGGLVGHEDFDSLTLPELWLTGEAGAGARRGAEEAARALQRLADAVAHPVRVVSVSPLPAPARDGATHDVTLEMGGFYLESGAAVGDGGRPDRLLLPPLFIEGRSVRFAATVSVDASATSAGTPHARFKCERVAAQTLGRRFRGLCGLRLKELLLRSPDTSGRVLFVAGGYDLHEAVAFLVDKAAPNYAWELERLLGRGVLTYAVGDGYEAPDGAPSAPLGGIVDDLMHYYIAVGGFCVVSAPGSYKTDCREGACPIHRRR